MYCLRNVKSKLKKKKKKKKEMVSEKIGDILCHFENDQKKKNNLSNIKKKSGEFWSIFHGLLRCRHFICTEMFVEGLQLLRTRDNQAAPGPGDAYKCASACPWG